MNMGPEGYVFEKYIAKILREHGFVTKVSQILEGYCVEHEVDVVATKEDITCLIECKYHNSPGTKSDIKTALYIYSRFLDIKKAHRIKNSANIPLEAWLVTNTKCTSDAIKYSNCAGLKVLAWHYPTIENLQYFIEARKLYPVSILSTITEKQKEALFNSNIILVKELKGLSKEKLAGLLGEDQKTVLKILDEASIIS
jgi:Holliday junction resolvase-like predicted endonuclease